VHVVTAVYISPLIKTRSPTFRARICASVKAASRTTSRPVSVKPAPRAMRSTGRDGSRYSHRVMRRWLRQAARPGGEMPNNHRPPIRRSSQGAICGGNLAPDQGSFATETHGTHAQLVSFLHDFGFELGQRGIGVCIIERPEKCPSPGRSRGSDRCRCKRRRRRARSPVPAPAKRVQDAFAHAFQIAVGAAQVVQSARHRILNVLVFAAAAFED